MLQLSADRMLNVVQYILADEGVGEKEFMDARRTVRGKIDRLAQGLLLDTDSAMYSSMPVNEEDELRKQGLLPDNVRLLPPLQPPMIPQDGPNPFPNLDPPVG